MRVYKYPVLSYRVIDGDTVEIVLDLGWHMTKKTALRIKGIDSPESRTRRALEKRAGLLVKRVVAQWVLRAGQIHASSEERPKYAGRTVGSLSSEQGSLNQYLLIEKLVRPYDGGKRGPWIDTELKSIIRRADSILKAG